MHRMSFRLPWGVVACLALVVVSALTAGCGAAGSAPQRTDDRRETKEAGNEVGLSPVKERAARDEGRRFCSGKTPLEVAKGVAVPALRAGTTHHFLDLVIDPTPKVAASPAYPQLVASLYATTLPAREGPAAAAGCAEELAASRGRQ